MKRARGGVPPDPTGDWVVRNGVLMTHAAAAVRVSHPGFRYGLGLFETMLAVAGRVVCAAEHLRRMQASARWLGLRGVPTAHEVRRGACELHAAWRRAGKPAAQVKLLMVRLFLAPAAIGRADADWTLTAEPIDPAEVARLRRGAAAGISRWVQPSMHALAPHKTLAYLDRWLTTRDARRAGRFDDLRLDERGDVAEGSLSSVFVVRDGIVRTPPTAGGILPGVTHARVVALARSARIAVRAERISRAALLAADEVFLTNSTKGVIPVVELDGRRVGNGRPGPITRRLMRLLDRDTLATLPSRIRGCRAARGRPGRACGEAPESARGRTTR